jgi:hypothetical protein
VTQAHQQLQEAVRQVADARRALAESRAVLAAEQAAFDAMNADLIAAREQANQRVLEAEATCRAIAQAHFEMTGEKKPVAGVEVKEKTTRTITDAEAALAWARESKIGLVPETFDAKAVLKVASVTDLPFVATTVEPQVQLATDLEKALAQVAS